MIKVSVLYPNRDGAKFDMDYYCARHMRMVQDRLDSALKGMAVEQGLSAAEPGTAPVYVAMGHLYFDTVEMFQQAFGPHAAEILGDIPNYTDIQPLIQISEVKIL